ncbi:MAG: fibronectin type III domain-containing protein [Saprospiraceae bacterium]|nr:fibronectin type III domain-containing protein [Saprospiraceae bacterium]
MQSFTRFTLTGFFLMLLTSMTSAQVLQPSVAVQMFIHNGGSFTTSSTLFSSAKATDKDIDKAVAGAQFLRLDQQELSSIVAQQPEALVLSLPYNGYTVEVELLKTEVLAPDFQVLTSESEERAVPVPAGVHYRGRVKGMVNSLAAFSFFEHEVMGLMSDDIYGNRVLGRMDVPNNTSEYILYEDAKLKAKNAFFCATEDKDQHDESSDQTQSTTEVNGCVRVYLEADYELYQNKGSVTNVTNYLTGVFNQVATLYANETISTVVSTIYVWTTADTYNNTNSSTALSQFRTLRTSFTGDIAHLASYGGNNIGGVAYLDVLCNNAYRYAYSNISSSYQNVPTYSWTVEVMTHEMGHNLGSNHTQWCGWTGGALDNCYTTEGGCAAGPAPTNGGTIMSYCHLTSYGINFNNGFGTQPGNKIRTRVSAATCLAATCSSGTSCGTPSGLSSSSITPTAATVSWSALSGATSYNLQWKTSSASTWNTVSSISSTSYNLTGLSASTTYNFKVQANCNGTLGSYSTTASFTTTAISCGTPAGLTATSITTASAVLGWSTLSGATAYNLQWKTTAATTWTSVNNLTTTTYNLGGLLASTSYQFRVQANCSGTLGTVSSAVTFTTLAPGCPDAYEPNNTRTSAPTVPVNTDIQAIIASVSDVDWYRFANTSSQRNIKVDLTNLPANYDLRLYSNNTLLGTSQNTGTTSERLIYNTTTVSGNYYAYVYRTSGTTSTQCYTLRISLSATSWPLSLQNGGNEDALTFEIPVTFIDQDVSIFPNPADETFAVEFSVAEDKTPVTVSVFDISGQMVRQQQADMPQGINRIDMSMDGVSAGVYFVQVRNGEQMSTSKLVIQH